MLVRGAKALSITPLSLTKCYTEHNLALCVVMLNVIFLIVMLIFIVLSVGFPLFCTLTLSIMRLSKAMEFYTKLSSSLSVLRLNVIFLIVRVSSA